jgi:hypothetical protein
MIHFLIIILKYYFETNDSLFGLTPFAFFSVDNPFTFSQEDMIHGKALANIYRMEYNVGHTLLGEPVAVFWAVAGALGKVVLYLIGCSLLPLFFFFVFSCLFFCFVFVFSCLTSSFFFFLFSFFFFLFGEILFQMQPAWWPTHKSVTPS